MQFATVPGKDCTSSSRSEREAPSFLLPLSCREKLGVRLKPINAKNNEERRHLAGRELLERVKARAFMMTACGRCGA